MREYPLDKKINPNNTALIVIDVQRDFCAADGVLAQMGRDVSGVDQIIDGIEGLIEVAEQASVLTLYTQQIYDRDKLNELQKEQYDLDGKLVTCDIHTNGYHLYRLNPPVSKIFPKYNYNIFSNPDFLNVLEDNNIKTLVITGADTVYCVETAIRNGFDLGYKVVVPRDLLIGNTKHADRNQRTLDLVDKVYGQLTTTDELVGLWRK